MKITESEFRDLLEKTEGPVVADFYADWCGPCRAFGPVFEKTGAGLKDKFSFCKINIDEADALCEELGISVVPTIMVFNNSRVVAQHEGGFPTAAELTKFINSSIKS
jgi:thioredoxin